MMYAKEIRVYFTNGDYLDKYNVIFFNRENYITVKYADGTIAHFYKGNIAGFEYLLDEEKNK